MYHNVTVYKQGDWTHDEMKRLAENRAEVLNRQEISSGKKFWHIGKFLSSRKLSDDSGPANLVLTSDC